MTSATRDRIMACGGRIIHHKEFNATGLQEILQAAEVPQGSIYFYFKLLMHKYELSKQNMVLLRS